MINHVKKCNLYLKYKLLYKLKICFKWLNKYVYKVGAIKLMFAKLSGWIYTLGRMQMADKAVFYH